VENARIGIPGEGVVVLPPGKSIANKLWIKDCRGVVLKLSNQDILPIPTMKIRKLERMMARMWKADQQTYTNGQLEYIQIQARTVQSVADAVSSKINLGISK